MLVVHAAAVHVQPGAGAHAGQHLPDPLALVVHPDVVQIQTLVGKVKVHAVEAHRVGHHRLGGGIGDDQGVLQAQPLLAAGQGQLLQLWQSREGRRGAFHILVPELAEIQALRLGIQGLAQQGHGIVQLRLGQSGLHQIQVRGGDPGTRVRAAQLHGAQRGHKAQEPCGLLGILAPKAGQIHGLRRVGDLLSSRQIHRVQKLHLRMRQTPVPQLLIVGAAGGVQLLQLVKVLELGGFPRLQDHGQLPGAGGDGLRLKALLHFGQRLGHGLGRNGTVLLLLGNDRGANPQEEEPRDVEQRDQLG